MANNDGLETLRSIDRSLGETYVYAIDGSASLSDNILIRYETPSSERKSDKCPTPDVMDYDNRAVVVFKYLGLEDTSDMEIEDMRPVPTVVENGVVTQLDYEKMRSQLGEMEDDGDD